LRALHVFPSYPGEPDEGSAVHARALTRELARLGVEVDVFTTRAPGLRARRTLDLRWPNELPPRDLVDGVPVRRFSALAFPNFAGAVAQRAGQRAWRRIATDLDPRAYADPEALFRSATRWPRGADLLVRLGRGPVAPGLLAAVRREARNRDVILAAHAPFGLMGWVAGAARRSRTPVALLPLIHDADPFHHLPSLHRLYERVGAVLTGTRHTAELLERHLPKSNPIVAGAPGVDVGTFDRAGVSGQRFRARHGLNGRRLLLFVGRKEPGKRYDLALHAAARLDGATLVMVGRDVDGAALPRGVVRFERLEPIELADAYDACDVLLHPSEQESFGMVCLEAWLRRKPVIANARCGASAALIEDGRDGLLCERAEEWGSAVQRLAANPQLACKMGEAGRAKVLATYTWEHAGRRALALYENLVDAGRA
jgi:glycosyltransferase involved in cell wall biosynthesis